ncbi:MULTISPECIES: hypothetical protein [Staphylococcus]|uniref:hypothetical protein n=1 Tax=Staphylococcus TaxID=1279 RepID=UPI0019542E7B|nr:MULTISPECIES: hypothetical protein [Staphylococcus]MCT2553858.1 hypothetical protein [Staphylococcus aureus]MCT2569008.1 hypothetical protein [Staphylococcus aureus]MCT2572846.1 hypothetical protein [Staphylococcus aureus]MCT2575577.1 hypothetical protein [Staphylococcus aureus]MEA1207904.1 hypothetical protein [Staphylococcus aureus]
MQKYPRVFRIKSNTKQLIKITSAINDLNNSDFVEKIIQETDLSNIDFSSYDDYGKKNYNTIQATYTISSSSNEKIETAAQKHGLTRSQVLNLFLSKYLNIPIDHRD